MGFNSEFKGLNYIHRSVHRTEWSVSNFWTDRNDDL